MAGRQGSTTRTLDRQTVMSWPHEALTGARVVYDEGRMTYALEESHRLAWSWLRGHTDTVELRELAVESCPYDVATRDACGRTARVEVMSPTRTNGEWTEVRS